MLKVICISIEIKHPELQDSLTIGKEYDVLGRLSVNYGDNSIIIDEYLVLCDKDIECYFPIDMFITQRERNLDDLGI